MGIIPLPDDYGDDCTGLYPPGHTPLLIKCFFSGIETGRLWHPGLPAAPNGYWDLIQHDPGPCAWGIHEPDPWAIGYNPVSTPGVYSTLRASPDIYVDAFTGSVAGFGKRYFANGFTSWYWDHYYGGWGFCCTPAELAAWIELVTPTVGPNPRLECMPTDNDQIVIKFCNKEDATNVKILVDTTIIT